MGLSCSLSVFALLFFCSKFVRGTEAEVVGGHLGANVAVVEGLSRAEGPVLVVGVGNLVGHRVVVLEVDAGGDLRDIAEVPVSTDAGSDWLTLDSLEVLVAVGELTRESHIALSALVVGSDADEAAGHIVAEEEELVLHVGGLVDDLSPDLLEGGHVVDGGHTDVELVADLDVNLGLDLGLTLLVVLNSSLNKIKENSLWSRFVQCVAK